MLRSGELDDHELSDHYTKVVSTFYVAFIVVLIMAENIFQARSVDISSDYSTTEANLKTEYIFCKHER